MEEQLDLLVITDGDGSEQHQRVLESVLSKVAQEGIGWRHTETRVLTPSETRELTGVSVDLLSEDEFNQQYKKIGELIDGERLLIYSRKTNPDLYKRLRTGMPINEALWLAYKETIARNGWGSVLNYHGVLVDKASKRGYPNILEVLFNHNVVAVDFGAPETIPYHMIGRGFLAEGCHWPLWNKDGQDTGKKAILLPLGLYDNEQDQIVCAHELIDHEIIGHALLGLKDHSITDVRPQDCIMSVPDSREEFVELARARRGLFFCGYCNEVYRNSSIYQQPKERV